MTISLVVGIDAGATATRVAVHTLDGARVGYARAGAGNPTAHGLNKAVAAITGALREALSGHDGSRVVASLAGVAGHVEQMAPDLAKAWADLGIPSAPRLTGDVEIAYTAGTPAPRRLAPALGHRSGGVGHQVLPAAPDRRRARLAAGRQGLRLLDRSRRRPAHRRRLRRSLHPPPLAGWPIWW
ncbi:hypothetical protein ACFSTC_44375 [Nonomuraea ferruginea]